MTMVNWNFWVMVDEDFSFFFFFFNLYCFTPLPLTKKGYKRRKRGSFSATWKWSTPGSVLSPTANWKRVLSPAQSLWSRVLASALYGLHTERCSLLEMGLNSQREKFKTISCFHPRWRYTRGTQHRKLSKQRKAEPEWKYYDIEKNVVLTQRVT